MFKIILLFETLISEIYQHHIIYILITCMEKRQIQNKEYTNLITVGLINTDGIILSNKNNIKL